MEKLQKYIREQEGKKKKKKNTKKEEEKSNKKTTKNAIFGVLYIFLVC